ncbi:hypothetical protein [Xylanimonas ulmi]|uniref:hypothetical protein n=1 Tax=Xylanimonas ulmi TaxID=228973 RepID=UPI0013EE41AA|nr:hypothetical protein [Xylanibacterium ulmi]
MPIDLLDGGLSVLRVTDADALEPHASELLDCGDIVADETAPLQHGEGRIVEGD